MNETKDVENMIQNGFSDPKKFYRELYLLSAYYYSIGKDEASVENLLHAFCQKWMGKEYIYPKMIKIIQKILKESKRYVLKNVDEVVFSPSEMKEIIEIGDDILRRLLFIMCFFAKVNGSLYCNAKDADIFKLSGYPTRADRRIPYLRRLFLMGKISPTLTGGDKVLVLDGTKENQLKDLDTDLEICNLPPLRIDRFDNPVAYLTEYLGGKIKECSGCGVKIEANGENNRTKWCERCAKEQRLKTWREANSNRKKKGEVREIEDSSAL